MRVLVTGATGFVGSHVVDQLITTGHQVSYISRPTSDIAWLQGKPVEWREGSLFDYSSLNSALSDIDAVIHCAGLTAARNEQEFIKGNYIATRNLLDAVRAYSPELKHFIHISSQAVCGPAKHAEIPTTEGDHCYPITAYGRSKLQAEEAVREFMLDFRATIVRPPAVYGPRDRAILTFFQAVSKRVVPIIGFDDKRISLVHVTDLARGIVMALGNDNAYGETFFIGSERDYSWPEIALVASRAMGRGRVLKLRLPHPLVLSIAGISGFIGRFMPKPPVLNYEKGIDITRPYWICSSAKAQRLLGYTQTFDLAKGMADTIEWYRDHGWL